MKIKENIINELRKIQALIGMIGVFLWGLFAFLFGSFFLKDFFFIDGFLALTSLIIFIFMSRLEFKIICSISK